MLDKTYQPTAMEARRYALWERSGAFAADPDSHKPPYAIMMPPPNVTGSLHMGHALTFTLQDVLVRYQRMRGRDVLWQPGTDHAGIATEIVVGNQLIAEGKAKSDLGRKEFVARVWQWKQASGGTITRQLRRLGASPDCYQFSSSHPHERERAVKQTFQTIDFAQRLGAPFVVMHLGTVAMQPITDILIKLAKKGSLFSREYVRKKLKAVEKREAVAPRYLPRVKDCLRRIIAYATTKKIRLGIEGRRGYEEIPSERELPALLDELNSAQVGYWHDFGHIQIKENLGFVDHAEWLRGIGSRAFGCHVQDCIWPAQDHQVPFAGDVDLAKLVPLLPRDCLWVWELSPRQGADEIRRSVETWKKHFGE